MILYNDLNDENKRILRQKLNVERIGPYYLEDHNIVIMTKAELFEYIYLDELNKFKDAINFITQIAQMQIKDADVNKDIMEKLLEDNDKVIRINNNIYAYRDN